MERREFLGLCGLGCVALGCRPRAPAPARAPASRHGQPEPERVLDEGRSEFNHVIVTEQGAIRNMYFEVEGRWLLQSTYDLDAPDSIHHEVFQTMVAGLLLAPDPRRLCMIGLGGGQLSNYLHRHLPELELDVVDICPQVIRLAHEWFDVPTDDPRYRVHQGDGRVFVDSLPAGSVDLLVHDAYRGHSIPRHLRSQEFFAACAQRLSSTGVTVANMHRSARRYPIDRATMASVFRHVYRFSSADLVQTTVVSSMAEDARTPAQLRETAEQLQPRFDIDLIGLAQRCLIDEGGWDDHAVVHDDFDPGELDDAARRHNLSCAPRCEGDER